MEKKRLVNALDIAMQLLEGYEPAWIDKTPDEFVATLERVAAEQKMHLTWGKSAASDSESAPAPKQVI